MRNPSPVPGDQASGQTQPARGYDLGSGIAMRIDRKAPPHTVT